MKDFDKILLDYLRLLLANFEMNFETDVGFEK